MPPLHSEIQDFSAEEEGSKIQTKVNQQRSDEARSRKRRKTEREVGKDSNLQKRLKRVVSGHKVTNHAKGALQQSCSPSHSTAASPLPNTHKSYSSKPGRRSARFIFGDTLGAQSAISPDTLADNPLGRDRSRVHLATEDEINDSHPLKASNKFLGRQASTGSYNLGHFTPHEYRQVHNHIGARGGRKQYRSYADRQTQHHNLNDNSSQGEAQSPTDSTVAIVARSTHRDPSSACFSKTSSGKFRTIDFHHALSAVANVGTNGKSMPTYRAQAVQQDKLRPRQFVERSDSRDSLTWRSSLEFPIDRASKIQAPRRTAHPIESRASQRMKLTSRTDESAPIASIRDDRESGDELHGCTTVWSNQNTTGAPLHSFLSNTTKPAQNSRPVSTPLKPKSSERSSMLNRHPTALSFRVCEYCASDFVLPTRVGATLMFISTEAKFELHSTDESVDRFPTLDLATGQNNLIFNYEDDRVIISGSTSGDRPSSIGIRFEDVSETTAFLECCRLIDSALKFHEIGLEMMVKRFAQLSKKFDQFRARRKREADAMSLADPAQITSESRNTPDAEQDQSTPITTVEMTSAADSILTTRRQSGRMSRSQPSTNTRSMGQSSPPKRWSAVNQIIAWSHPVVYPETGIKRVTVDFKDLDRLDEGEFLNDNLISFALQKIEDEMDKHHRPRVQLFSTFFYTALTAKDGRKGFNYDAVKRWTKNVDIFTSEYIVVPINIDLHWFLAIICNLPYLVKKSSKKTCSPMDGTLGAEASSVRDSPAEAAVLEPEKSDQMDLDLTLKTKAITMPQSSQMTHGLATRRVNCEMKDRSTTPPTMETGESKRVRANNPRRYDPESCIIMTLDSLGNAHTSEIRQIKDYIANEAREKRGMIVELNDMQGMTVKGLPQQMNFCDCGVYLLEYIAEFAKNPSEFVRMALDRNFGSKEDFMNFQPSDRRASLRGELLRLHTEQEKNRRAKKKMRGSVQLADTPDAMALIQATPRS